jgi:hypothetical protein
MRRKSNLMKLGDAIQSFLETMSLDEKLLQFSIRNHWDELSGERISRHTRRIEFKKDGIMIVEFDSDAARNEALYVKTELMNRLNEYAGKNYIKDIIFQ